MRRRSAGSDKEDWGKGELSDESSPFPQTPIPPLSKTSGLIESLLSGFRVGGGRGEYRARLNDATVPYLRVSAWAAGGAE